MDVDYKQCLVLLALTLVLGSALGLPITILNPWTGHVETELTVPKSDSEIILEIDRQAPSQDNESSKVDSRDGSEYLDEDGQPLYKWINKFPYG
eukprot:maker-scaffold499_size154954-snap-gene-0.16 protein:Tk03759 transcript:maker-scaffold499_size154954-snap-gene-0.16-mRNA-1 annotation:"hypothetical protein"